MQVDLTSDGSELRGHLAKAPGVPTADILVLAHGFPAGPRGASRSGHTYPQLADRLAAEAGWNVMSFNFRGTGESGGSFSLGGWMADLRSAVDYARRVPEVRSVWLCGFGTGGALALCAAGEDERVAGVASFAAPADFDAWAQDPEALLRTARDLGLVREGRFPHDMEAWSRDLRELRPVSLVGKVPPRPLLIVHGSEDESVPPVDARALADAAEGLAELRVLTGAGHRLRHDPRAVAVLLGWMEREGT